MYLKDIKLAIVQPVIPLFRKDFITLLFDKIGSSRVFGYREQEALQKKGNWYDKRVLEHLPTIYKGGLIIYNPFKLVFSEYNVLVLMWHPGCIMNWLILLTKRLHRKKVIVWGQGISIKRYLKEEKKLDRWLKLMFKLSDGAWIYMEKELHLWKNVEPNKPIVALGNTISGISDIINHRPHLTKDELKRKYSIAEPVVLIYCSRFISNLRRTDLLEETIKRLSSNNFGFIIIGDGPNKPDFSPYENVHYFGAVYENEVKRELFCIADAYYQPAYLGLSIVEAMAYGKPVLTFRRTDKTTQGVEYGYIKEGKTGLLFDSVEDAVEKITQTSPNEYSRMGMTAREMISRHATPEQMVNNALRLLEMI